MYIYYTHIVYIYILLYIYMGVSSNGGTPIAGWFVVENPIKVDYLGIAGYPYFRKHHKYIYICIYLYSYIYYITYIYNFIEC